MVMVFSLRPVKWQELQEGLLYGKLESAEIKRATKAEEEWILVLHATDGVDYVLADELGIVACQSVSQLEKMIEKIPLNRVNF